MPRKSMWFEAPRIGAPPSIQQAYGDVQARIEPGRPPVIQPLYATPGVVSEGNVNNDADSDRCSVDIQTGGSVSGGSINHQVDHSYGSLQLVHSWSRVGLDKNHRIYRTRAFVSWNYAAA